jgi:hypothetical protein
LEGCPQGRVVIKTKKNRFSKTNHPGFWPPLQGRGMPEQLAVAGFNHTVKFACKADILYRLKLQLLQGFVMPNGRKSYRPSLVGYGILDIPKP